MTSKEGGEGWSDRVKRMEGERDGVGDTSRLLVLLRREREINELYNIDRKESSIITVKNNLTRKLSFRKTTEDNKNPTSKKGKPFVKKIFYKLTNTFRKVFTKYLSKQSLENCDEDKHEDIFPSGRHFADFSQSQSFFKSLSDSQNQSNAANNALIVSTTASSKYSSLNTSEIPSIPCSIKSKIHATVHLQNKKAKSQSSKLCHKSCNDVQGDLSEQVMKMKDQAKQNLVEQFPSITNTIYFLFSDNPIPMLMSLSSTKISELLFNTRTLLFSPLLPMIHSFDIILFVIIKFLQRVILVLDYAELPSFLDRQCTVNDQCLVNIRSIFIQIWCNLISEDII